MWLRFVPEYMNCQLAKYIVQCPLPGKSATDYAVCLLSI